MSPQNPSPTETIDSLEILEIPFATTPDSQYTISETTNTTQATILNSTAHNNVATESHRPQFHYSVSVTNDLSHHRLTTSLTKLPSTPPPLDVPSSHESLRRRYSVIDPPNKTGTGGQRRISSGVAGRPQRRAALIWILFVFCATNFCLGMCNSLIAPFFPHEAVDIKRSTATMAGIVMGSFECVMFLLAPVIGSYMHEIGSRFLLLSGPFIVGVCTILFGLLHMSSGGATFFACALAIRLVAGVGAISYYVTSIAVRSLVFINSFGFAFGMVQASLTLGLVAGPAVGGALYALGGFGLPFLVCGGFVLFLDVLQALTIPCMQLLGDSSAEDQKKKDDDTTVDGSGDGKAIHKPSLLLLCKNSKILLSFVMYCWAGFTVTFYESIISLHILPLLDGVVSRVGLIILIAGVCEAGCAPVIGWLQDKGVVSARCAIVVGYVLSGCGFLLMGPSPLLPFFKGPTLWLVAVGTAVHGCGLGCFFSAPFRVASDSAAKAGFPANEQTFGILSGGFAAFYSFGAFVGPIIAGVLYDHIGFRWSSTLVSFMTTVVLVLSVIRVFILK